MNSSVLSDSKDIDDKFRQFVVYLISFSEGLTSFATLSVYYLVKDDLKLSPPEVSLIFIIPALPWIFRIFISFCIDCISLSSSNKRSYLILFSSLQALGYLILVLTPVSVFSCIISQFIISISSAFCTTVAESLIVNSTRGDAKKGSEIIGDFITAKAIAHFLVAYFSGYLLEYFSKTYIFMVTATFPLMITSGAFFLNEAPVIASKWPGFESQFNNVIRFLVSPQLLPQVLFIFLYTAGPDYDDALFFFCTNELHFGARFMGVLKLSYSIAALVGVQLYRRVFLKWKFKSIVIATNIIIIPLYISPIILVTRFNKKLHISDEIFVLAGGVLIEAASEIQILPLISHIAQICPISLETSIFAATLSIRSVGRVISNSTSALMGYMFGITANDFSKLPIFIIVCSICKVVIMGAVLLINKESNKEVVELITIENSMSQEDEEDEV